MADGTVTYSIMTVSNQSALTKIAEIDNDVFAVNVATHEVRKSAEVPANEWNDMSNSTEWLFFYIKERVE